MTSSTFTALNKMFLIYRIFPTQHNQWYPVLLAILMDRFEYYKPVSDANDALYPFSLLNTLHIWRLRGGSYLFCLNRSSSFSLDWWGSSMEKKKKCSPSLLHRPTGWGPSLAWSEAPCWAAEHPCWALISIKQWEDWILNASWGCYSC